MPDQLDDPLCSFVARYCRCRHGLAVDLGPLGRQAPESGVRGLLGGHLALPTQRGPGRERLRVSVARAVSLAAVAPDLHHDVAQLGTAALAAAIELAADHQTTADPGADRDHH